MAGYGTGAAQRGEQRHVGAEPAYAFTHCPGVAKQSADSTFPCCHGIHLNLSSAYTQRMP